MVRYLERLIPVPGRIDDRQTHHRSVVSMMRSDLNKHVSGPERMAFNVSRADRNLQALFVRLDDGDAQGFTRAMYDMPVGSLWDISVSVAISHKVNVDGKTRERPATEHEHAVRLVRERIEKNGYSVLDLNVEEHQVRTINRKGGKFHIHYCPVTAIVEVVDQAKAEDSLIQGIGPKRTFGFGMPFVSPIDGGTMK